MDEQLEAKAQKIVESWFWQMAEGHNFRWKNAVKSITLFYESAPLESDVAQLVLEYLRTRSAVTQLVIGHKKWTFDEPGWNTKDAWYQTAPSEQWAGTESKKVRVYWVLVETGDGAADGPYVVENGCKYKVEHSYYWDVAGEPQLPQSSSGVQYSIQGFTRDRETGLYSFIIEKRETVQQDIPLYDSVKTLFEEVSEAQHLGVKQNNVAATGLAASVGNGERVERHLTKNPDCTTDITNRKVKDKKVEQARTVVRKELRGTSAATTDRNLTTAEVATKIAAAQEIGETRTVEKTDTDLRNLTVEKFTPAATPITLAKSCEKETSVHTDTTVELVQAGAADGSVEQTVEPNKRKTVSVRKNDDGKTADKTTTEQTWTEKTGGGSSNSGNGVVTTTTERKENTTSTPTAAPGVNKVVEIEETPNDHGSKTTVKRTTTYKPEKKSATGGTTSRTVTVESGVNQTSVPSESTAVNKEVDISVSLNDHGSMSTQKRVTEFKPDSKTATGGTTSRTVTIESGVNQTDAPTDSPAVNKEVEVSVSLNDHGSMSTQKRVTTYTEQSATAISNFATERATTIVKENTTGNANAVMGNASAQPNDHGSQTTQVTEYTPIPKDSGWITWQSVEEGPTHTYTYECGIRVFKNLAAVPTPPGGSRVHISPNINRYGLYDGSIAYSKLIKWAQSGSGETYGGSQAGSISFVYVSDYTIGSDSNGEMTITPIFTTATVSTRTYYGHGNDGSEAATAASSQSVPGLHLPHRTYITSGTSSIVRDMKRAEAKLQAALANRKARGT